MYKVKTKEFEKNFDKYVSIGQKEEIAVTQNGNIIFRIVPSKTTLEKTAESFFDMLPEGATIGVDPNERG